MLLLQVYRLSEVMKLLRTAMENKRWDLAAHTIVLATVRVLRNGDKPHTGKSVSSISSAINNRAGGENTVKTRGRRV